MSSVMSRAAELHNAMFEAVLAGDLAALRALYHPDYIYRGIDGTEGDADGGIAVAETYMNAFPDMTFEITHQWIAGDNVSVIEFSASGTHTGPLGEIAPTNKTVSVVGCNIVEVRDGKVWREREYVDSLSLMQKLGAI